MICPEERMIPVFLPRSVRVLALLHDLLKKKALQEKQVLVKARLLFSWRGENVGGTGCRYDNQVYSVAQSSFTGASEQETKNAAEALACKCD